jgi:hypothetical protein
MNLKDNVMVEKGREEVAQTDSGSYPTVGFHIRDVESPDR